MNVNVRLARLLVMTACSACSSTSTTTTTDGGSDSAVGVGVDAPVPVRTAVLRKMFVGDTDRVFKTSPTAWRAFGADLDKTATESCRSATAIADGDDGIDNSFGANVLPVLMQNGFAIPSLQWSESIQQGAARPVLLRMAFPTLSVRIGKPLGSPPDFFTGNGVWTLSSLVASELPMTDVVVAGPSTDSTDSVLLLLPFGKTVLRLRVRRLSIRATNEMTSGTLAGILDTSELIEAARQAIGGSNASACMSFDGIATSIRAAQDILADGSQNPSTDCNAISIGMGFEGAAMAFGVAENDPPPANACP